MDSDWLQHRASQVGSCPTLSCTSLIYAVFGAPKLEGPYRRSAPLLTSISTCPRTRACLCYLPGSPYPNRYGTFHIQFGQFFGLCPVGVFVNDPASVKHILQTGFQSGAYGKGPVFKLQYKVVCARCGVART